MGDTSQNRLAYVHNLLMASQAQLASISQQYWRRQCALCDAPQGLRYPSGQAKNALLDVCGLGTMDLTPVTPPSQMPGHFFPPVRTQADNKLATDLESSLGQVMSDFEETFQRSRARQESQTYLSDGGEYRPNGRRYHSLPRPGEIC